MRVPEPVTLRQVMRYIERSYGSTVPVPDAVARWYEGAASSAGRPDPLAPPAFSTRHEDALALARRDRPPPDPLQRLIGCPPPVWMNRGDQKAPDGICVFIHGSQRCRERAAHLAWIGCTTGEHLDKSAMCPRHAAHVAAWKTPLHCLRCWDALGIVSDARVIRIEEYQGE